MSCFYGLSDAGETTECSGSWFLCRNKKIHVSSTLWSKFGSVWSRSMMSSYTYIRRSFWSSFSSLGTIFTHTFHMPKFSVIIFKTLTCNLRSVCRRSLQTFATRRWLQFYWLKAYPNWKSSFTLHPSLIPSFFFCHSKTCVRDILLYPYTCWSFSSGWDRIFHNWTKNFRFIRCNVGFSVLIAE